MIPTWLKRLLIVALLTLPSLYSLLQQLDAPKFCDNHDDCLYFVSAKSLADGGGYRIESLPGEPAQTKYPPLYPLLLSVAWRIAPHFPESLTPAIVLTWAAIPTILWLSIFFYGRMGFKGWRVWLLVALFAINPYTIAFGLTLLSEHLFMALMMASLLCVDRALDEKHRGWALGAGVIMGLAYLARSAGIVALGVIPLYFFWKKQRTSAIAFAAGMFPFVAAWMGWVKLHQVHAIDPELMYYIDYFGYQLYNVNLREFPMLLWKNLDGLIWSFGSLIVPRITDSWFVKILSQVIAIASIAGIVKMFRAGRAVPYILVSIASSFMLLIWHFPPNERFAFPMFPLVLAGLLVEMEHFAGMLKLGLKHPDRSQRVAGMVLASAMALIGIAALALQVFVSQIYFPETAKAARVKRDEQREAYRWFREQTPESASVLAMRDPLFYLETGRHAISMPVAPMYWYREDRDAVVDTFKSLSPYARLHGLSYSYFLANDFGWAAVDSGDQAKITKVIRANGDLEPVFQRGETTVYKVRGAGELAGR